MRNGIRKAAFVIAAGACTIGALFSTRTARAGTLYTTGFESPPFANGSQLSGQDNWFAPSPTNPAGFPFNLNPAAAVISNVNPSSGTQSVQVLGSNLQPDAGVNASTTGYYNAIGSYRQSIGYAAGTGTTTVQADIYVAGPTTANTNFFSASVAALGNGGVGLGELAISSDGNVHAYTGDDSTPAFLYNAPITLGHWHTLAIVDNFGTSTTSFIVDGNVLGTTPFAGDYANDQVLNRGSLITYAGVDSTTNLKANYTAYYDNFSISQTPEPSVMVALLVGGFCTIQRRRTA